MGLAKNYLNRTHFEKGFSGLQMRFHHCEIPVLPTPKYRMIQFWLSVGENNFIKSKRDFCANAKICTLYISYFHPVVYVFDNIY